MKQHNNPPPFMAYYQSSSESEADHIIIPSQPPLLEANKDYHANMKQQQQEEEQEHNNIDARGKESPVVVTSSQDPPSCASKREEERGVGALLEGEEDNSIGREKLKRHRIEVAGRVWIPEIWEQEELLKDWIDCTAFDAPLVPSKITTARAALVEQDRRRTSNATTASAGLSIENRDLDFNVHMALSFNVEVQNTQTFSDVKKNAKQKGSDAIPQNREK